MNKTNLVCAICGLPATHWVTIEDVRKEYRYRDVPRCQKHTHMATTIYKRVTTAKIIKRSRKRRKK